MRRNGSNAAFCLLLVASAAVVAGHAMLIPAARWREDEYIILDMGRGFLTTYAARVGAWSPRPLSELLVAAYGAAVASLRTQLIVPVLLGCWTLLVGGLGAACAIGRGDRRQGITLCLLLPALMLLTSTPAEVFFWPAASLAYLPTLAGMSFVVIAAARLGGWSRLTDAPRGQRGAVLAALLVAVNASEIGACFALLLGIGSMPGQWRDLRRACWVWLPPAVEALVILLDFSAFRGHAGEAMAPGSGTLLHLDASVTASVGSLLREFFGAFPLRTGDGVDVPTLTVASVLVTVAIRALLFSGLGLGSGRAALAPGDLVPAGALLGACGVSLMSAYYNFGVACCERHETMRQSMFLLASLSIASACPCKPRPAMRACAGLLA